MEKEIAPDMPERTRSIYFDLTEEELSGLALNDEITLVVKAKVKSVSAPYEYTDEDGEKKTDPYGDVRFKILSYELRSENEFEKLARMEDEED